MARQGKNRKKANAALAAYKTVVERPQQVVATTNNTNNTNQENTTNNTTKKETTKQSTWEWIKETVAAVKEAIIDPDTTIEKMDKKIANQDKAIKDNNTRIESKKANRSRKIKVVALKGISWIKGLADKAKDFIGKHPTISKVAAVVGVTVIGTAGILATASTLGMLWLVVGMPADWILVAAGLCNLIVWSTIVFCLANKAAEQIDSLQ